MPRPVAALAVLPLALLTACQANHHRHHADSAGAQRVPAAPEAAKATMDTLASLAGEWELVSADGTTGPGAVFSMTAGGTALREIMFPGHGHEMTNLYHMDGSNIVCTHYCAAGNQPRMVAAALTQTDEGPTLDFAFDSVSNFTDAQGHYMGGLKLVIEDESSIRQEWTSFDASGKPAGTVVFNLKRKG